MKKFRALVLPLTAAFILATAPDASAQLSSLAPLTSSLSSSPTQDSSPTPESLARKAEAAVEARYNNLGYTRVAQFDEVSESFPDSSDERQSAGELKLTGSLHGLHDRFHQAWYRDSQYRYELHQFPHSFIENYVAYINSNGLQQNSGHHPYGVYAYSNDQWIYVVVVNSAK